MTATAPVRQHAEQPAVPPAPPTSTRRGAPLHRLVRGRPDDPSWGRPALLALLVLTAVLYLWDLAASGYGNEFYAAAAQAGSSSWKAWLFGSLDGGNAITVDKPPAALWVMGLSVRVFGLSSWSVLAPQALEGVAAVGMLYAAVTRTSGRVAGLVAGAALAVTPVAVLMFRFDNPDALLVLLLAAGAYCVVRACEGGATRWLLLAGTAVGFGFLTKMGQALLVVPGFGLAYLLCGPRTWLRRVLQLLGALAAVVLSAGWFVALVSLWPAASRPYIAGSGDNSELGLALGYNGLGRLFGSSSGGGGGGGNFAGTPGLTRLFNAEMGYEISWLLPAALLAVPLGLWLTRRAPRTDATRAAVLLWGGWLLVTGYTLSEMQGGEHPYYSLALAPAIAALVATVGRLLWQQRTSPVARTAAAVLVSVTAIWSSVLLRRAGVDTAVCALVMAAAAVLAGLAVLGGLTSRRLATAAAVAALLATLGGTTAFASSTAATPHTGTIVYAVSGSSGGGFGPQGAGGSGGPGGSAETATSSSALVALLQQTSSRWAAAASGASTANTLQLAAQRSVMAIGGFTGSDPAPTLAQFEAWVKSGQIHYYIGGAQGGGFGGRGGQDSGSGSIASWVAQHYTATTVGGYTVYDLTATAH